MKYLKLYDGYLFGDKEISADEQYVKDFLIHVGMFFKNIIDPINHDNPYPDEKLAINMGSDKVNVYVTGKYFKGVNILTCEVYTRTPPNYIVKFSFDNDVIEWLDVSNGMPDILSYIILKITPYMENQNTFGGVFHKDRLKELSELRFNLKEVEMYIGAEKFNL